MPANRTLTSPPRSRPLTSELCTHRTPGGRPIPARNGAAPSPTPSGQPIEIGTSGRRPPPVSAATSKPANRHASFWDAACRPSSATSITPSNPAAVGPPGPLTEHRCAAGISAPGTKTARPSNASPTGTNEGPPNSAATAQSADLHHRNPLLPRRHSTRVGHRRPCRVTRGMAAGGRSPLRTVAAVAAADVQPALGCRGRYACR